MKSQLQAVQWTMVKKTRNKLKTVDMKKTREKYKKTILYNTRNYFCTLIMLHMHKTTFNLKCKSCI